MDLPDAPVKKDPELNDEMATMVYSAEVMNDKTEQKPAALPQSKSQKVKSELESQIFKLVANFDDEKKNTV